MAQSVVLHTMCPRSSDPFHVVTCYEKEVTTSWTHSTVWTEDLQNWDENSILPDTYRIGLCRIAVCCLLYKTSNIKC